MTDTIDQAVSVGGMAKAPVSRRGFVAGAAVASAAGAAMVALPASAFTMGGTSSYEGPYALGAQTMHGLFVAPRGKADLDVVVIVPDAATLTPAVRALAQQHAAQGRLAVVADLQATYGASTLGGLPAMKAALVADKARFRRHPMGSNRVTFVAA